MDDDKKDFKILTSFVNSYKSKLMIRGEAGLKKARGGKPIEQILPITKEQLKAQIDEDDRDITLDYDIFQKIKKMEKGKNGKKSTGAFIQPSILKKKQEQKENTD